MSLVLKDSKQVYVHSLYASSVQNATSRNRINVSLYEPIIVPDGYTCHLSVVTAELPITGSAGNHLYYLLGSSLKGYNNATFNGTNTTGAYLAKFPIFSPAGYLNNFTNLNNFSCKLSDRTIMNFDLYILGEDGADIVFGSGINWSMTLQFDIVRNVTD